MARRDFTAARQSMEMLKQFVDDDVIIHRLEKQIALMESRDRALMPQRKP